MADVVDKALETLATENREESVEELLAGAQEQLDVAVVEARRIGVNVEPQMLPIVGLLAAVVARAYEAADANIELRDAASEIRDAAAVAANEAQREAIGHLNWLRLHKALVELHRRSGRVTRHRDNGMVVELAHGASYLGGEIVAAIESGRLRLLVAPV